MPEERSPTARLKDKVRELWNARQSLTSGQLHDSWQRNIRGWWNDFKLADWRREVTDLSGWIRHQMRKTARPVVWKGHGAQSHPIMGA